MHLARLHQVAAHTEDVARTRAFWTDVLGARWLAEFDPPGMLFFDFSGVRVLFDRASPRAVLYFRVDDIERAYAELLERGVAFEGEPHRIHRDEDGTFGDPGSEEWMAFFKDPGGNTIALAARR